MDLAILMTARCNASCSHCATSCGPYRTEALSRETLISVMDQAAVLSEGEPLRFFLSGGEPFLDLDLLVDVVRHGKRLGATVSCVTNGSWASSPQRARDVAGRVRRAGLDSLAVSTSRFHRQFVPQRRVALALAAARAAGLRCIVKSVREQTDAQPPSSLRSWSRAAGAEKVQDIPLLPHLRDGESLPDSAYRRRRGLPRGRCPARLLTLRETGEAFTCCTPGSFTKLLSLGNVGQATLADLRDRFHLGGAQQILRWHGPAHFARSARAAGLGNLLRTSYSNVCDLCTHIASTPALAAVATQAAAAYEARQMQTIGVQPGR